MTRVAVIGGGISGLAAAWDLAHTPRMQVTLIEGADRLGGKIATEEFSGVGLETGPDSFLARVPAARQLASQAGLADDLVAPGTGQAWLWTRGQLRRLPSGLVLGVPSDLRALARSRVLTLAGTARATLDLVLGGRPMDSGEDVSVGELVRARMGRAVQLGLVDPLVGGINAGHTDQLSAAVAAPQLLEAAQRDRSLIRGLRAAGAAGGRVFDVGQARGASPVGSVPGETGAGAPVFLTVRGGLGRLVEALARGIARAEGSALITGDGARALARGRSSWTVRLASGREVEAEAVILACPALVAAGLLGDVSPAASRALHAIETASVVMTLLAYAPSALPKRIPGSGFLVPRTEGRLLTAASWVGAKWPHLDTGKLLIRASVGRIDDDRATRMEDQEIVANVHMELVAAMGLVRPPIETRVHRWPSAFPQFAPGHLGRMADVEHKLARDAPGIVLAGAALRGVGIATCISGGRESAARAVAAAAERAEWPH